MAPPVVGNSFFSKRTSYSLLPKMRIAIDVRSLMEGRHSGVEEYTTKIIWALSRVAPQHEYVLFYNARRQVTLPPLPKAAKLTGFRYPNKLLNVTQGLFAWPAWDQLVEADCFFVPNFRLLPIQSGVPVVTTIHDLSFVRFPEFFSRRRQLWHRLMQPRRLIARSKRLIAVSAATARDLHDLYGIPLDKIAVVHSGISPLPVTARNSLSAVRQRYGLKSPYMLYLGAFEPRKNIPSIIHAFSAIAQSIPHDLVLAGEEGWLKQPIAQALEESPYRNRIHHLGFIPEADKWTLYAGASLFVYPSFYEGFGFPPLEALACGTPVVTSQNSSLPEVVGKWATLIDPYNPGELAIVMQERLRTAIRLSPVTTQAIQTEYSWHKTAQTTLEVLASAVADKQV